MYLAISYIILLLIVIYMISLLLYFVGNFLSVKNKINEESIPISIIVAVKNGEKSLPILLNDLEHQNYKGMIEYLIVDDESTDNTQKIIKQFQNKNNKFIYISSTEGNQQLFFKKRALDAGIKNAKFDTLLFTDVDCRLKPSWAKSMAQSFHEDVDYVIGFSEVPYYNNIITWFQRIDFLMLLTAARGICNLKIPFASTGQNQAYRKKLYDEIGFLSLSNSIQGDDSLFLQLCIKNNINIIFNDNPKSFVTSRIETKFWNLIKQRIRWSGDAKIMWKFNKIFFSIIVATFSTNLLIMILTYESIFLKSTYTSYLQYILFIKFILELLIYIVGALKLKFKLNLPLFLYWFILEIPYVICMGIGSIFVKYISWRGQKTI